MGISHDRQIIFVFHLHCSFKKVAPSNVAAAAFCRITDTWLTNSCCRLEHTSSTLSKEWYFLAGLPSGRFDVLLVCLRQLSCVSQVSSHSAGTPTLGSVTNSIFEQENSECCVPQKSDVIITVRNSGSDIGTVQRNASGLNLFSCLSFFISYFVSFLADPEEAISIHVSANSDHAAEIQGADNELSLRPQLKSQVRRDQMQTSKVTQGQI